MFTYNPEEEAEHSAGHEHRRTLRDKGEEEEEGGARCVAM